MYIIYNGKIVLQDGIVENHAIIVEEDRIIKLIPEEERLNYENYELVDAKGGLISPGFIDIHSDYIENIISPRPTALMNFNLGLKEAERILITHGITTMYHSLSLLNSRGKDNVKMVRKEKTVIDLIEAIANTRSQNHLLRHRVHARFEIDNLSMVDTVINLIKEDKVHLLSFMDHTPGQGQYRNLEVYKEILRGYDPNLSDEDLEMKIEKRRSKVKVKVDSLLHMAKIARDHGLSLASHDDDTVDKVRFNERFGTVISEFPITLEVAREAKKQGLWTVAGGPNVLMGRSHSGNLSAIEGILDGSINILCSDYYPLSMLHSLFLMNEKYGIPLHQMFAMVTINPAKAVNIDDEVGSIEPGKKADILIIHEKEDFPAITSCMINGQFVYKMKYRLDVIGDRLLECAI